LITGLAANPTPLRSETGYLEATDRDTLVFDTAYAAYDGTIDGPYTPPARYFTTGSGREVTIVDPIGLTLVGRYRDGGDLAVLQNDTLGTDVEFMLMAQRNSAPAAGDLEGRYIVVQFGMTQGPPPDNDRQGFAAKGRIDIDGTGAITWHDYTYNRDGDIDPLQVVHPPSELAISSAGWLHWRNTSTGSILFRGGISADGNLILLGAQQGFAGRAGVRFLLREGQTSSVADISGTYLTAGVSWVSHANSSGSFRMGSYPMHGESSLNGSGIGIWTSTFPGSGLGGAPVDATYSVTDYGEVEIQLYTFRALVGGTGSGGDLFIATGPFDPGILVPWLIVGLR
jgi:hypothetical protein